MEPVGQNRVEYYPKKEFIWILQDLFVDTWWYHGSWKTIYFGPIIATFLEMIYKTNLYPMENFVGSFANKTRHVTTSFGQMLK